MTTLENLQELWQHVFKDEQLIIQLTKAHAANCAKESIDPLQESPDESAVTVESTKWGPIRLKVWSASALGDNFMSDAYIASAKYQNGTAEHRAFIKVISHLIHHLIIFKQFHLQLLFCLGPASQ